MNDSSQFSSHRDSSYKGMEQFQVYLNKTQIDGTWEPPGIEDEHVVVHGVDKIFYTPISAKSAFSFHDEGRICSTAKPEPRASPRALRPLPPHSKRLIHRADMSQEIYATLHLGMDHVLAKLLLDAPPLPESLKLQTETQSLGTTWVQVTDAYERRKSMLQRRKEKEHTKNKSKRREELPAKKNKKKQEAEKDSKKKTKHKTKSSSSGTKSASPRNGKSSPSVKTEKKSHKKRSTSTSPRVPKLESGSTAVETKASEQPDAYGASILKKLHKLSMCENVTFGSNKYKAIVRWLELDKGKDSGTSPELVELLSKLQLEAAAEKKSKKLSRKRSLETGPLDDTLRSEQRNKRLLNAERGRRQKKFAAYVDEDEVVYESGEEEEEPEYSGGYSDSDEAEFMPELDNSPPPEKAKKRAGRQPLKRQKKLVEEQKESEPPASSAAASYKSSREQFAAVVAKIRADEVASGTETTGTADTKYLSYEKKAKPVKKATPAKAGASSKSAIVLDDSEEEDEEEEEEEEEETKEAQEDSSTDDDHDMFDLNEEDVYVVEAILCVKEGRALLTAGGQRPKETDLYLVKWDGYNELTWEPDENIPRRLIDMFRERERAKRACQYQIKTASERREVVNVTTQAKEIIYMIQWINQEVPVWESRSTLPTKTQVWLDKVLGAGSTVKKRTKAVKQYVYQ
ncbi:hypothetical protein PRNP1_010796 [Phytophthora ramorum]